MALEYIVDCLVSGMVLAEDVRPLGSIVRLSAGQVLEPYSIERLHFSGIKHVKIEASDGVPLLKNTTLLNSSLFDDCVYHIRQMLTDIKENNAKILTNYYDILSDVIVPNVMTYIDNFCDSTFKVLNECSDETYFTEAHSVNTMSLVALITKSMGLSMEARKEIILGAIMHDIGKVFISDDILYAHRNLTADEYDIMKTHPILGRDAMLNKVCPSLIVLECILLHHERLDGSGYPYGLKLNQLSIASRVVAACDVFEAIASKRPYKTSVELMEVAKICRNESGLDTHVIDLIISKLSGCYAGLGVHLSNGYSGKVLPSPIPSRPMVECFYPDRRVIDLSRFDNRYVNIIAYFSYDATT